MRALVLFFFFKSLISNSDQNQLTDNTQRLNTDTQRGKLVPAWPLILLLVRILDFYISVISFSRCHFVCNANVTHRISCFRLHCPLSLSKSNHLYLCSNMAAVYLLSASVHYLQYLVTVSFTRKYITPVRSEWGFIWWGKTRAVILYMMVSFKQAIGIFVL